LLQEPISNEVGLIKVNNELCACLDGYTADKWGYLKNDFLTVSVWDIIDKTYKRIGLPIPSVEELKTLLDDKVWNLYRDGITCTLNQVDSDYATDLMKKYCARTVAELTAFVAAIRPSFASLLHNFLDRKPYTTEIPEVDELLKDSFHYILYQESIMRFLTWCGIPEEETYSVIKKISKKKFDEKELMELKDTLFKNFSEKVSEPEKFHDIWTVIEDAVRYSFNSSHALSVAWDSLYCAYLKSHYPYEYYATVLEHYIKNTKKTSKLVSELDYFGINLSPIQFRKSTGHYTFDKELKTIYKGIESIKFCNSSIATELYSLRNNPYDTFIDLLVDMEDLSINSRQLQILIKLNYFSEFGHNGKLLKQVDLYNDLYNRKQIKKQDLDKLNVPEWIVAKYSAKETPKLYKEIDTASIVKELSCKIENSKITIMEQLQAEMEYLAYLTTTEPQMINHYYVKEFRTYTKKNRPYVVLYNISNGEEIRTKVTNEKQFIRATFEQGNILKVSKFELKNKKKKVDGKWNDTDEQEQILNEWEVVA
jgi:DNA polymerase III alpha subunit